MLVLPDRGMPKYHGGGIILKDNYRCTSASLLVPYHSLYAGLKYCISTLSLMVRIRYGTSSVSVNVWWVGWLVSWFVGLLVCWFVDLLFCRSVCWFGMFPP